MIPNIQIARAYRDLLTPARYKAYYGGRGSAKSWTFGRVLVTRAACEPIKILCGREIQKSIDDSVHALLVNQIESLGLTDYYDITKNSIKGIHSGSSIIYAGLRHNAKEIKSKEGIDICWIEEAEGVSEESWKILIPTIRKPGSEIWLSFNPDDPKAPTYQRFVQNPPPGSIVRKVNYYDNPWFPEVLRQEMEYDKRVDYEKYKHIWEGEPRVYTDAQVFHGKFTVEPFETPETSEFMFGADWGFAKDPTVLLRCFVLGRTLYIDHEAYGVGVEIDKTPKLFSEIPMSDKYASRADSARPETISYMKAHGFPRMEPVYKWSGSVMDGIEFIRSFEKIIIHPRCKHTADEFRLYSFKIHKQTGDILPDVEDKNNHCIDALRYALQPMIKRNNSGIISTSLTIGGGLL